MPIDFAYDENYGWSVAKDGDIETVEGDEYIRQTIVTNVVDPFVNEGALPLTGDKLAELQLDIETFLREENQYATDPISIRVTKIDQEDESVTIDISTARYDTSVST